MGRAEQPAADDPLAVVTSRLLGDEHEAVLDGICAAVFDQRPVYAGLRDQAGFRHGISRLVHLHCATVVERRRLTATEVVILHLIGAQRAREGIPEEEMVGTVKAAMTAGWSHFVDLLAEACTTPAAMRAALKEVYARNVAFGDDVQAGLRTGFRSEVEQRLPSHIRTQSAVVDRLTEGSWTDDELFAHAREYGVPLLVPLGPLLVTGPADMGSLRQAASEVAESVSGVVEGPARTAGTVPHVVLVANEADAEHRPGMLERAREAALAAGAVVVVSRPADRPSSFEPAYRLAEADLAFARAARPRGGLVECDELILYRMLDSAAPEERADFCVRVLGRLPGLPVDKRTELVETAEVLLSVGWNARAASEAMGVHYQTMRYRQRRLQEATGRNLADHVDRLLLELAIRIHRGWLTALADTAPTA